jgi:DNA-binding response OmpR family regulator
MLKSKKILIVDDEEDFLALLRYALEERGFEVASASNAIEAGILISSQLPAVILMDIKMPGINGFQACEALKKNSLTKDVPIIVVSALSDDADIRKARELGVVDYLVKPVNMEKLIQKIREIAG